MNSGKGDVKQDGQQKLKFAGASTSNLTLEHLTYKDIPGTNNSYRVDAGKSSTVTKKHAHVYAKRAGGGKELYSVNIDGSGHDGYSGTKIPRKHADHFKDIGFKIPSDITLESISIEGLADGSFEIFTLIEKQVEKPIWARW